MADDFAISVGTPDRVLSAQIRRVFDDSIVNDLEPSDIGAVATPVAVSVAAVIRPSISGTSFQAPYTTTLTASSSRFLTQVSTSTRLQIVTSSGSRSNLGLATSIASNGSLTFTTFRSDSTTGLCVLPLDTGSPTTGTTFIVQSSNTAFTIANGSYYMLASTGLLGPYSMTLADSNFTLQFSYDSAYFAWATANSTGAELVAGINLVSASSVAPGMVYYFNDKILRIA
jgi:hypothetical protein